MPTPNLSIRLGVLVFLLGLTIIECVLYWKHFRPDRDDMGLGKQVQKHSVTAAAFNLNEEKTSVVWPIGVCDSKREKLTKMDRRFLLLYGNGAFVPKDQVEKAGLKKTK